MPSWRLVSRLFYARHFASLAATLIVGLWTSPIAIADDVPGIGNWSNYHYSLDETPMEVVFVHDRLGQGFPLLTVPRSYVYFADSLQPVDEGPLPSRLEAHSVGLAFADPDGVAWSVAVHDYAVTHQRSKKMAAKALRDRQYLVQLYPNGNPNYPEAVRESTARNREQTQLLYGDLPELANAAGSAAYYVGTEADNFISVRCYNPINPKYFCRYTFLLTEGLSAAADFLDFRAHGGREYANRRVAFARQVSCRFIQEC